MTNNFNFVERFAPLSSLQMTIIERDDGRFVMAPSDLISCNFQPDHIVVWYKNEGEDSPRFAQMGEFVNYRQVMTALLPIDLPWGAECPQDLLAVLELAPQEVLVAYATWAGDFRPGPYATWAGDSHPGRYPNVRETWGWLNRQWGELRP